MNTGDERSAVGQPGGIQRAVPASRLAASRREPAPGGLELVRAFINTSDIEEGTDALSSAAAAEAWCRARELPEVGDGIDEADRVRLIEVREAIRDLITCRDLTGSPDEARSVLLRAARSSPLVVGFDARGRAALGPGGTGVDALIGRILGEILTATVAGTWDRLKVCRNDLCRWAYYDLSRNHSGVWCSMAVCGNRTKGRTYRGRHRAGTDA